MLFCQLMKKESPQRWWKLFLRLWKSQRRKISLIVWVWPWNLWKFSIIIMPSKSKVAVVPRARWKNRKWHVVEGADPKHLHLLIFIFFWLLGLLNLLRRSIIWILGDRWSLPFVFLVLIVLFDDSLGDWLLETCSPSCFFYGLFVFGVLPDKIKLFLTSDKSTYSVVWW